MVGSRHNGTMRRRGVNLLLIGLLVGFATPAARAANNAQFVSQLVPRALIADTTYTVTVTMKNTGTETWTASDSYRLGSQNPQDNHTWLGWTSRVFLAETDAVAPGESKAFVIALSTPDTPGRYDFQWRMVREGVEWFGDSTTNCSIPVYVIGSPVESVNTLDFFLSDHLDSGLTGSHASSQVVDGLKNYYLKWSAQAFEVHVWDEDTIYCREDLTFSNDSYYVFQPGSWMRRQMGVGERINMTGNVTHWYNSSFEVYDSYVFPYWMTLEAHIPDLDLGGDIGIEDVIILRYDYGFNHEKFYYSKEWGWVLWEWYSPTNLFRQASLFNRIGPAAPVPGQDCMGSVAVELAPGQGQTLSVRAPRETHVLAIPAGAFPESIHVIAYDPPEMPSAPCPGANVAFTGAGIRTTVTGNRTPDTRVLVTLAYTETHAAGRRETHFVVGRYLPLANTWQVLASSAHPESNAVAAWTDSFTWFQVLAVDSNDIPVPRVTLSKTNLVRNETSLLDGRSSSDSDDTHLSYRWFVSPDSTISLADSTCSTTTFSTPTVGLFSIVLQVSDADTSARSETFTVRVGSWRGDITGAGDAPDGRVDIADVQRLRPCYGLRESSTEFESSLDLDHDGAVGIEDYFIQAGNYGK